MFLDIFGFFDGDWFNNKISGFILDVLSFLPKLLYFFAACLLSVGDFFQAGFRKIAGLDPIIVSGEKITGDSLFTIITNSVTGIGGGKFSALSIAFWSLIILGVLLLIIFTIIAVIRIEYMPDKEKGNSKTNIIKNALIGIANIAIIPIACLFGLFLGNQMIVIIDDLTSRISTSQADIYQYYDKWTSASTNPMLVTNESETFFAYEIFGEIIPTSSEPYSGMVFKASAHSSNRFRKYGEEYLTQIKSSGTSLGFLNDGTVNEPELAANIIDIGFGMSAKLKNTPASGYTLSSSGISNEYYREGLFNFIGKTSGIKNFSKYNVKMVWFFYDLWSYNYIVTFVAMILIGKLYYSFCLMLMARTVEGFALFIFAPIAASLMPLDNSALGRWRKQFVGKYLLILAMVFGINILSPLLQIFQQFKFFNLAVLDYLVYTLFIIAGLNAANSIIKSVMGILTEKGDAVYEGSLSQARQTNDAFTSGVKNTFTAGRIVGSGVKTAASIAGHGVGHSVGKITEWSRRGMSRTQERNAMGDTTRMDNESRERAKQTLQGMSEEERGRLADDMFKTELGKDYVAKNFGGNEGAARRAIVSGQEWRFGRGYQDIAFDNEDLQTYMHERDLFNRTKAGSSAAEGSDEWVKGINKFSDLSNRKRQTRLMHRAPINAQQQAIQQRRQDIIDHRPTTRLGRGIARMRQGTARAIGRFNDSAVGRGLRSAGSNIVQLTQDLLGDTTIHGGQMMNYMRNNRRNNRNDGTRP